MQAIISIVFLLSGWTNGANFSMGIGFPEEQDLFIAPIGIIEASTPLYEVDKFKIGMYLTHMSSIPDTRDNSWDTYSEEYDPYSSDLNMVSIKATIKFSQAKVLCPYPWRIPPPEPSC